MARPKILDGKVLLGLGKGLIEGVDREIKLSTPDGGKAPPRAAVLRDLLSEGLAGREAARAAAGKSTGDTQPLNA